MVEKVIRYWQELTDESKLLIKHIGFASVALYVVFQLVGFLLPVVITGYACYWVCNNVFAENPRAMK